MTFSSSVIDQMGIIDTITFNPSTGEYDIYYVVGAWGTATVTLRATDPEGSYAEVSFDVTSVLVTDYDLQWFDQGSWVGVPSDQGILTNDELRARAIHTPIPPEFVVPISWKHKEWFDASDDVYAADAVTGLWQYPLITDQYSDGAGGTWYEFQLVTAADWGFTPEIDFGQFRYAAQMLPAKEENVYDIQDPVWEGIELSDGQTFFEPNGNPPEFGGGDRFFAERNLPTGRAESVLHEKVNLVVSLDRNVRPGRHVPVAIKLFDPDHYSVIPFDANDTGGATLPRDNIVAGGGTTYAAGSGTDGTGANLAESVDILGGTLSIKTPLQVLARQPTNNFKAATFNPRIPRRNIDIASDGMTIFRVDKPTNPVPQTPLLTIWRHLYIEVDSMDEPDLASSDQPSIISGGNVTAIAGNTITIDQEIKGETARFQGGTIVLLDANMVELRTFNVVSNTEGAAPQVELSVNVPAGAAKFRDLYDDDVEHAVTALDMVPDVALFASRFRPACIAFDPAKSDLAATSDDPVNQIAQIPFDLNTNPFPNEFEIDALFNQWRDSATEADFWAAYVLGAFQPYMYYDNDNDDEDGAVIGITSKDVAITVLFRETARDIKTEEPTTFVIGEADLWRVVAVHEVGHQFGLDHHPTEDGPIMHPDSYQTMPVEQLVFSLKGLQKITARDYPKESN